MRSWPVKQVDITENDGYSPAGLKIPGRRRSYGINVLKWPVETDTEAHSVKERAKTNRDNKCKIMEYLKYMDGKWIR